MQIPMPSLTMQMPTPSLFLPRLSHLIIIILTNHGSDQQFVTPSESEVDSINFFSNTECHFGSDNSDFVFTEFNQKVNDLVLEVRVKLKFGAGCYCLFIFDKDLALNLKTIQMTLMCLSLNHQTIHHKLVDYNHLGQKHEHEGDLTSYC
jgi:hypothetical protein